MIELPFYYGFDVGLDVPADDVYKMLTIIEKHAAELAKTDPLFTQIAKDMKGFQKRGVESSADLVPIHPGSRQMDAREGRVGQEVGFQDRHDVSLALRIGSQDGRLNARPTISKGAP